MLNAEFWSTYNTARRSRNRNRVTTKTRSSRRRTKNIEEDEGAPHRLDGSRKKILPGKQEEAG